MAQLNKTHLIIISLLLFGSAIATFASGTYRPPVHSKSKDPYSRQDIARGKGLFYGKKLGTGKTCASCHDKAKNNEFKRYVLLRKASKLKASINNCITQPSRTNGKALATGSKNLIGLGAYIIAKYRLPKTTIENLQ